MREIKLACSDKVTLVDDADYAWLSKFRWQETKSNSLSTSYAVRYYWNRVTKRRTCISMQRLIMGDPEGFTVDHVNRDGLDNQRTNLRLAKHWQNCCNQRRRRTSKAGFIGVKRTRTGSFIGRVRKQQVDYSTKTLRDPVEVARLRDLLAIELHGEFAVTNFPKESYG